MINYNKTVAMVSLKDYQDKLCKEHKLRGYDLNIVLLEDKNTIYIDIPLTGYLEEHTLETRNKAKILSGMETKPCLSSVCKEVSNINLRENRDKKFIMTVFLTDSTIDFKEVSELFYKLEGTIMSIEHDFRIVSDTIDADGLVKALTDAVQKIQKDYIEIARVSAKRVTKGHFKVDLTLFTKEQGTSGTVCLTNSEYIQNKVFDFNIYLPKVFSAPLVDILEYTTTIQDNTRQFLSK